MNFIRALFDFLKERKKLFLIPLITLIVSVGSLLVFSQNSVMAPFIYTLF
jgi:hypothetical protein